MTISVHPGLHNKLRDPLRNAPNHVSGSLTKISNDYNDDLKSTVTSS